jgi:hypothetical protein
MMKVGDLVKYSAPRGRSTWLKGIGVVTETNLDRPAHVRVSFPNVGVHAWMFKETLEVLNETR